MLREHVFNLPSMKTTLGSAMILRCWEPVATESDKSLSRAKLDALPENATITDIGSFPNTLLFPRMALNL